MVAAVTYIRRFHNNSGPWHENNLVCRPEPCLSRMNIPTQAPTRLEWATRRTRLPQISPANRYPPKARPLS
jgi:hypothetical protein